jgi:hypothetical protein
MTTTFKDRLLDELVAHIEAEPRAARVRPARPRWRVAGLAAAGTLAAALVVGAVGGPWHSTPAFAVTSNPDGSITFTLHELADPGAATAALRRKGVRAVVLKATRSQSCPYPPREPVRDPEWLDMSKGVAVSSTEAGDTEVIIWPRGIPAGHTLVLAMYPPLHGFSSPQVFLAFPRDPAPSCVRVINFQEVPVPTAPPR